MMNTAASAQVFDKKFVMAAALVGAVYAAVVATLGALVGKEAAGVAGVALTALATGIFKQFEYRCGDSSYSQVAFSVSKCFSVCWLAFFWRRPIFCPK
jgi:hypothetical protein